MVSIHDRPPEIDERLVPGHWEGDFIKGAHNRSSVGTLVERTTLFTVLAKMENATAEATLDGFSHVLNRIEAISNIHSEWLPRVALRIGSRAATGR